ncbi:hypothetical protein [Roseibium album]|uniref:hypothetical protein n=1 Tax=Roseibium album TaxID=311410 RepID=UPI002493069C|nr:hypothetical protein [Roseibium album]
MRDHAMRLATQSVSLKASEAADHAVSQSDIAKKIFADKPARAPMSCDFAAVRSQWFKHYAEAGGAYVEVCGENVAPFSPDPVVAQVADQVFFKRHPELKDRKLSLECTEGDFRVEWMDLYVEYGGRVTTVCGDRVGR